MKFAALLFAAVAATFSALPAHAQIDSREGIALQNQISSLHRDIDDLRDQVSNGGSSGGSMLGGRRNSSSSSSESGNSDLMVGLVERIGRLEENARQLNGRIDELANAQQRQHDELAKQISDLQFRLDNGGASAMPPAVSTAPGTASATGAGGRTVVVGMPGQSVSPPPAMLGTVPAKSITPSVATPPPPPVPPASAAPRGADLAIQEGNAALARRDYTASEQAAREVLANKASPRAYDAQFLLAQSLSGQKRSLDAAIAYGDLYARSKQGAHAQDALLGLATSQSALGDKHSACVALDSLTAQFPTPRADIAARAAASRTANGCR